MGCRVAVVVVGMPGSGKSTCIEVASRVLGVPRVSMGDAVRAEARRRGIPFEKLNEFADELRRVRGPQVVAELTMPLLQSMDSDVCIVEGVRSLYEVDYFREAGLRVVVVAIHSSPRTRFERLLKRGRPDDPRDWGSFVERDRRELSWGIGSVIALADYMIVNEGSVEELRDACVNTIRRALRELLEDRPQRG